jgi:hypothetical protein
MSAASDTRPLLPPVTVTTGVVPRRPQVRPFGGLKPCPDSSSNTSRAGVQHRLQLLDLDRGELAPRRARPLRRQGLPAAGCPGPPPPACLMTPAHALRPVIARARDLSH